MYSLRPWTCTVPTGPTSPVRCRLLLLELWDRTIVVLALESLLVHHKVLEGSKSKNGAAWLLFVRWLRFCRYFSKLRMSCPPSKRFWFVPSTCAQLSPLPLGGLHSSSSSDPSSWRSPRELNRKTKNERAKIEFCQGRAPRIQQQQ